VQEISDINLIGLGVSSYSGFAWGRHLHFSSEVVDVSVRVDVIDLHRLSHKYFLGIVLNILNAHLWLQVPLSV
jgi:hypothetical protein